MNLSKPQDNRAELIQFGVEIETIIPTTSSITVGAYHAGRHVTSGKEVATGYLLRAPSFQGQYWRADRDSSISPDSGFQACEFVSPVLSGDEGLACLREFVQFANRVGAKVNRSCGLHITVGIKSILGTVEHKAVARFLRALAHIAHQNAWAIYAQTGTGRHQIHYAHPLAPECEGHLKALQKATGYDAADLTTQCGRGMINFRKAFDGEQGAVEFRAFASTLNVGKIFHHLATALGLCRRAATVQTFGRFQKSEKKNRAGNAVEALKRLWRILGWVDPVPNRDCALGLFGPLHTEFGDYRRVALEMSQKFEQRFPAANL